MDASEKKELIEKNTEEILEESELAKAIESKEPLRHYIGFEISGKIHLGTGLMSMLKVRDFMEAGIDCSVFLADWHSWINDKLGGNPGIIKKFAVGYFREGMKASLKCAGGNPEKLKFVLGSDIYHNNDMYWTTLIDISKNVSLSRIRRSITIMGRKEGEEVDFAKLIYPPMQVADIFIQKINIAHAGMDQRKAHVIARDVAMKLSFSPLLNRKGEQIKPIMIHHPLILGLGKPPVWPVPSENLQELWASLKMSKSKPDTCIFIHDSPDEIKRKVNNAFCPEKETGFNPLINWCERIIFPLKSGLEVKRLKKFGGDAKYSSIQQLKDDFLEGNLHPLDLKAAVADSLIDILKPAREHFSKGKPKQMLEELEKLLKKSG
jgi:tyrosyl-tRNA synthetase